MLHIATAHADAQTVTSFDLPAQPLIDSLRAIASQTSTNVFFEPKLVAGKTAPAVKAQLSIDAALKQLLEGSGLTYRNSDDKTVLIVPVNDATKPVADLSATDRRLRLAQEHARGNEVEGPAEDSVAPSNENEIVVTGTHIRGVNNLASPMTVYTREDIDRSGRSSADEFIRTLPANFKGGTQGAYPESGITGYAFYNPGRASAANLRGLGNSATLTLLNGHRVAGSGTGGLVDISAIPLSAVKRIDVQTDGASAIYGTDAVGGVVNIVLNDKFDGAESSLRYDIPDAGDGKQLLASQTLGHTSDRTSGLLTLQYQDANSVDARDRPFTREAPAPSDLLPNIRRYSAVLSGNYDALPSVRVYSDMLFGHLENQNSKTGTDGWAQSFDITGKFASVNAGARWQAFNDWELDGNLLFSQNDVGQVWTYSSISWPGYQLGDTFITQFSIVGAAELKANGGLFEIAGGRVKMAVGASYREDRFAQKRFDGTRSDIANNNRAAYAELYVPLVGESNSRPLLQRLDFSAALRRDTYSQFGGTTNPRIGLVWSPAQSIDARATFSKSYRVPNPNELLTVAGSTYVFLYGPGIFPVPDGATGGVLFYPNEKLNPEHARSFTTGLDFHPIGAPQFTASLNYYRLKFSGRLIDAPHITDLNILRRPEVYGSLIGHFADDAQLQQLIASYTARGIQLFDFTGNGGSGIRFYLPYGKLNASDVKTSGFDLNAAYTFTLLAGKLTLSESASYIEKISTSFCATCVDSDLSNVYGQPPRLRSRSMIAWDYNSLSLNASLNYVASYKDTLVLPTAEISEYTTVDIAARYTAAALGGATLGVDVVNLFNREPPRTSRTLDGLRYDPSNADGIGRTFALQIQKRW